MGKEPCHADNAMTGLKACITDDTRRTVSKIIRTGREGLCIVQSGMCTGRADLYRRASQLHPQHVAACVQDLLGGARAVLHILDALHGVAAQYADVLSSSPKKGLLQNQPCRRAVYADILRRIGGKVLLIADQPACTRDAVRCGCGAAHGRGAVAVCLLFAQQFVVGIAAAGPGRVGTSDIFPVAFGGR